MDTIETSEHINHNRRRFLGAAAMTLATAHFAWSGSLMRNRARRRSQNCPL